jgi:GNAT superfamily N-acetyltransferase
MTVPELAERWRKWLAGEYQAVIFSVSGSEDLAYALFRRDTEAVCLRQFFVVPNARRRGYGRECFRILREQIWPLNVRLLVEVLSHNATAIAFWRAVGYKEYCLTMEIMPDGRCN